MAGLEQKPFGEIVKKIANDPALGALALCMPHLAKLKGVLSESWRRRSS